MPVSATSMLTASSVAVASHARPSLPRGVLDGVVDQVVDDLADGLLVGEDHGLVVQPARVERRGSRFLVCGAAAVRLDARFQHRDQVQRSVVEDLLARLEPGQAEQVEDQLVEPLGLLVDSLEEPGVDRLVVEGPVQQGLGVGLDRGQRRLELVGGVGDEVLPHPLEPAQLGDVVEDETAPGDGWPGRGVPRTDRNRLWPREAGSRPGRVSSPS